MCEAYLFHLFICLFGLRESLSAKHKSYMPCCIVRYMNMYLVATEELSQKQSFLKEKLAASGGIETHVTQLSGFCYQLSYQGS